MNTIAKVCFWIAACAISSAAYAGSVGLTWQDNSTNESGFRIERAIGGGDFTEIATVSSNVTTYTDSGVEPGSYGLYYRVCAYNDAGNSGYSNIAAPQVTNNAPQHVAISRTSWADTQYSGVALIAGFESNGIDDDASLDDPWITSTGAMIKIVSPGGVQYDVRVTTSATPNARSFGSYTAIAGEPTPSAPGEIDTMFVGGALTPGTRYNVVYKFRTGSSWSTMRTAGHFTTQPTSDKRWQVSWQPPSGNPYVYGYRLIVTQDGDVVQTIDTGNVTTYTVTGLAYELGYEFTVQALYYVAGEVVGGPLSNVVEEEGL